MQRAEHQKERARRMQDQPWFKTLREVGVSEDSGLIAQLLSMGNITLKRSEELKAQRESFLQLWRNSLPLVDMIAFRMKGFTEGRKQILEQYIKAVRGIASVNDAAAVLGAAKRELSDKPENEISSYIAGLIEKIEVEGF